MKRFTILFLFVFFMITTSSAEHIKFMGVPVGGNVAAFKDSLKAKGFIYKKCFKTLYSFEGIFANEVVAVEVLASPKTKQVCKIIVYFPQKDTWKGLKSDYFRKKNLYKEKYLLDKDFEFFSSPYDEGDGYEMRAVSLGKCNFASFYYATGGHIMIQIDEKQRIKITYEDRENIKISQSELDQKALEDI